MIESVKPPRWFWVVSGLLLVWGLAGCVAFYGHVAFGAELGETEWEKAYFAALPAWFNWDYALAVGGGLLGSAAMLARSRLAQLFYIASLIGVVIQFGYVFGATDMIAHKGALTTLFPAFILAVALFQIWFARRAAASGWIS
jgi:hypothetical protein